jgi:hypothetical protein
MTDVHFPENGDGSLCHLRHKGTCQGLAQPRFFGKLLEVTCRHLLCTGMAPFRTSCLSPAGFVHGEARWTGRCFASRLQALAGGDLSERTRGRTRSRALPGALRNEAKEVKEFEAESVARVECAGRARQGMTTAPQYWRIIVSDWEG